MQIVLKAVSDTVETGLTKRHIISAIEAERDTIFDDNVRYFSHFWRGVGLVGKTEGLRKA
jgi:hypothetical protein